jgi:hypothetical protein
MFIEITQDGGGVIEFPRNSVCGFFTDAVETCIVYMFKGENGVAFVHDTGQLSISSIFRLAKRCGKINSISYAINHSLISGIAQKKHRDRMVRICAILGFKKEVNKIEINSGFIAVSKDNKVSECCSLDEFCLSTEFTCTPDKIRRHHINVLNNLFSPKNSQSIPVDIQFEMGSYTENPKLIKTEQEMMKRAHTELSNGDHDYIYNLECARSMGIV